MSMIAATMEHSFPTLTYLKKLLRHFNDNWPLCEIPGSKIIVRYAVFHDDAAILCTSICIILFFHNSPSIHSPHS